jgi:hypothetical protein
MGVMGGVRGAGRTARDRRVALGEALEDTDRETPGSATSPGGIRAGRSWKDILKLADWNWLKLSG